MTFNFFQKRKQDPEGPSQQLIRSWAVNVTDASRSSPPFMWPVDVFRSQEEAEQFLEELRRRHAGSKNLKFDIYPSEREAESLVPWFEKYWGPRPALPGRERGGQAAEE